MSNASTIVEVGNEKYTVAEAIERKNQIEVEKLFLANLKSQYVNDFLNENYDSALNLVEALLLMRKDDIEILELKDIILSKIGKK